MYWIYLWIWANFLSWIALPLCLFCCPVERSTLIPVSVCSQYLTSLLAAFYWTFLSNNSDQFKADAARCHGDNVQCYSTRYHRVFWNILSTGGPTQTWYPSIFWDTMHLLEAFFDYPIKALLEWPDSFSCLPLFNSFVVLPTLIVCKWRIKPALWAVKSMGFYVMP